MTVKCLKCQTDNPADSKFCKECATALPPSEELAVSLTKTIETPVKDLSTGSVFAGRYQIIEELGRGGMGKVYEGLGDKEKAIVNYQKFLEIWKDADPGLPDPADAKNRLAALSESLR